MTYKTGMIFPALFNLEYCMKMRAGLLPYITFRKCRILFSVNYMKWSLCNHVETSMGLLSRGNNGNIMENINMPIRTLRNNMD